MDKIGFEPINPEGMGLQPIATRPRCRLSNYLAEEVRFELTRQLTLTNGFQDRLRYPESFG